MPPKKDAKPAPPKPTFKNGYEVAAEITGIILLLVIVSGFFVNSSLSKLFNRDPNAPAYSFPSLGNVDIGSKIYNKNDVVVREEPAGTKLGIQDKGDYGTIEEGPTTLYGKTWWKIDYNDFPDGWVEEEFITGQMVLFFIKNFFPALFNSAIIVAWIFTVIFASLIVFVMVRMKQLDTKAKQNKDVEEHAEIVRPTSSVTASAIVAASSGAPMNLPTEDIVPQPVMDARWQHILALIESFNENDWRQAIIESDIILEEMLEKMGYDGDTIGEKLKNIEESDFTSLDKAWEAHKVRNRIAHMGSNFKLGQSEAKRIIGLYKEVFEEFYFI